MNDDLVKAHLNVYAILQNLENLVTLDSTMTEMTREWDATIQFSVLNGPSAYVEFKNGLCRHGRGRHPGASVRLFFVSPKHLNAMFEGKANPIPLKGLTRLKFLQNDFKRLTDRLEYYLRPQNGKKKEKRFTQVSTTLQLYTAFHAVRELALLDGVSKTIASRIGPGPLQVEVLPKGPYIHLDFAKGDVKVRKSLAEKPIARMTFKNMRVASRLLAGELDAFQAVAAGDIMLQGQIPMIDNVNLILDRVEAYLA